MTGAAARSSACRLAHSRAGLPACWFAGLACCYFVPLRFALFSSSVWSLVDKDKFIICSGFTNCCRKVIEGQWLYNTLAIHLI